MDESQHRTGHGTRGIDSPTFETRIGAVTVLTVVLGLLVAGFAAAEPAPAQAAEERLDTDAWETRSVGDEVWMVPASSHGGTTLFVCEAGQPLCNTDSIQEAIEFAADGDTVRIIDNGTYEEVLNIDDTNRLTVEAGAGVSPTLDPAVDQRAINVTTSNVTIDGLEIRSQSAQGLYVSGGPVTLTDNTFVDTAEPTGKDCEYAVRLEGSSADRSTIEANVFENHRHGLLLAGTSGVEITDNTFTNSCLTGVLISTGTGGTVSSVDSGRIAGNEFTGAGFAGLAYVQTDTSKSITNVVVEDNTFQDNKRHVDATFYGPCPDDVALDATLENNDFDLAAKAECVIDPSIQDAVDAAPASSSVSVIAGTYEESVEISTDGIQLVPAGDAAPRILFAPDSVTGVPAVNVAAADVTVRGFEITRVAADDRGTDSAHAQGLVVRDSGATIADNTIVGEGLPGDRAYERFDGLMVIDNEDAHDIRLEGNTVKGFFSGIVVTSAYADTTVENVELVGNKASMNAHGLVLKYHTDFPGSQPLDVTGEENEFVDNDRRNLVVTDGGTFQGYNVADFSCSQIGLLGPIQVQAGDVLQTAECVAGEGGTLQLAGTTFDQTLSIQTCDLTVTGAGESATEIRANSTVTGRNHGFTLQVASDGASIQDLAVTRAVTDEQVADSGHTKAIGVNFDRCGDGAASGEVSFSSVTATLTDETGNDTFGNAVWVSNFNAAGGERAAIDADFTGLTAVNDGVAPEDRSEFGGAALAVCAVGAPVNVTATGSTFTGSQKGVHSADCPAATDVDIRDGDLLDNGVAYRNDDSNASIVLRHNSIQANDLGVNNSAEVTVDARENWWGDPTGPEDVGLAVDTEICTGVVPCQDPASDVDLLEGQNVEGNVQYFQWCRTPDCTVLTTSPVTSVPTES